LPTALSAVSGFNGPLDAAVHGGVVTALVGYGYYNATSNTFGSATKPGGTIANVNLAYSTATKLWTGTFNTGTLAALPTGVTTYTMIVASHDKASPANTGTETLAIPPIANIANAGGAGAASTVTVGASTVTATATSTVTATSISTATTTAISTAITTAVSTLTQTATSTISSIVSSISTLTTSTVSVAVSTLIQTAQAVPSWAYVMMFLFLVIGGLVGFVLKRGQ